MIGPAIVQQEALPMRDGYPCRVPPADYRYSRLDGPQAHRLPWLDQLIQGPGCDQMPDPLQVVLLGNHPFQYIKRN